MEGNIDKQDTGEAKTDRGKERGMMRTYATQMEAARKGIVTPEMKAVAKKEYRSEEEIRELMGRLERLMGQLVTLSDRDEEVFAPLAAAYALPSGTDEEKAEKTRVMEGRLLDASLVPLEIMEKSLEGLEIVKILAEKGSRMAVSDAGVAAQFLRASLGGAVMNVYINTKSMKDRAKAEELNARAKELTEKGFALADEVYGAVLQKLI